MIDVSKKLTFTRQRSSAWLSHGDQVDGGIMAIEMLNYSQLGERLGCSREAARALVKRLRLPRQKANDGKVLVSVDLSEINHRPMTARSPAGHHPVTATLKARLEESEAALAKVEATASGHRADFEYERRRAEQLMSELLTAIEEAMAAREQTARLEGELALLRQETSDVRTDRDAWRTQVERLTRNERDRLPWWRRLAGLTGAQSARKASYVRSHPGSAARS
jgi:hypothetical protein